MGICHAVECRVLAIARGIGAIVRGRLALERSVRPRFGAHPSFQRSPQVGPPAVGLRIPLRRAFALEAFGHKHSLTPGSVMAPVFTSEANFPEVCHATRAHARPAAARRKTH